MKKQLAPAVAVVAVIIALVLVAGYFMAPRNQDPANLQAKVRSAKKAADK